MTQVIAPDEGHIVHNRLTHVLEVAQIGRRIAERLLRDEPKQCATIGGIDPDVVESAALAHDLGHPPFGHIAEEELDRLLVVRGIADGFEGNAQSFRVITKLSVRRAAVPGLDLARATLAATLKYPWPRDTDGDRQKKFGYYASEKDDFDFARKLERIQHRQTAEATLMDLADDIAYSLSDLEDFIRAGKIPLGKLQYDPAEQAAFVASASKKLLKKYSTTSEQIQKRLMRLLDGLPIEHTYSGTIRERANIRNVTGYLMDNYVKGVSINTHPKDDQTYIKLDKELRLEIAILKHLTFHYVICDPGLAIIQHGQRTIIRGLFEVFYQGAISDDAHQSDFFPVRLKESIEAIGGDNGEVLKKKKTRCIADFIAGMSDREAIELHQRLHGNSARSLIRSWV